jgi:hypothetical protein
MNISELVNTLVGMRQEYGDIEVVLPQCGDDETNLITWDAMISIVNVKKDKNNQDVVEIL